MKERKKERKKERPFRYTMGTEFASLIEENVGIFAHLIDWYWFDIAFGQFFG